MTSAEQTPTISSSRISALNRDGTIPLYLSLATCLKQDIEAGHYTASTPLPAERDLMTLYGISRDTVRKAIRVLEDQGFVYSEHGRGTFPAPVVARTMSRHVESFTGDSRRRGLKPGQKILFLGTVHATLAHAGILGCTPGASLTRLRRIRLIDDHPIGIQDSYLRLPAGHDIEHERLLELGSLYELLTRDLNLVPTEAIETIGAAAVPSDQAPLLGVGKGTPVLAWDRVTFTQRREPFEYCEMLYLPEYRYKTRISLNALAQKVE